MFVKFAPLTAGKVEGNLPSGRVPELRFEALPALKLAAVPELVI